MWLMAHPHTHPHMRPHAACQCLDQWEDPTGKPWPQPLPKPVCTLSSGTMRAHSSVSRASLLHDATLRAVTHNARWHGADLRTSASPTPPLPPHHWPFSVGSPANQRCSGALGRGCTHPCSPRMCPSLSPPHTCNHCNARGSMPSAGPRSTIQRTLMRSQLQRFALRCVALLALYSWQRRPTSQGSC